MQFEEWVKSKHPEFYDESLRDWAKRATIGAAIAGAGLGAVKTGSYFTEPPPKQLIKMKIDAKKNLDTKNRMLNAKDPREMMKQK
jgi:hypothetical protein